MLRSIGCMSLTTRPPMRISPSVSSSRPAVRRRTVVLPEPDGPTSTSSSPSSISRSTPSTATAPPGKTLVTPWSVTSAISAPFRVLRDQVAVPERAALRRPFEVLEVDRDDPKAPVVAVLPLEVVEQRPDVVAAHVDTGRDRTLDGLDVAAEVRDALGILDHGLPVGHGVVVRGAVLGDHERDVAVVALEAHQERGQGRRLDRPPHRRQRPVRRHLLERERAVDAARPDDGRLVEVDAEEVDWRRDLLEVAGLHELQWPDALLVQLDQIGGIAAAQDRVEEPAVAVTVEPARCFRLAGHVRQVERDANLAAAALVPEGVHRAPVGEQHVVRRGKCLWPVGDARRLDAVAVAEESRHPGLVVRDPGIDEVAEPVEDEARVLDEAVDDLARGPAAVVLQALRQIPVIKGGERRDPALEHPFDEGPVEVEPFAVGGAAPVGLDPRPGDREAVRPHTERGHQVEVLRPAVVVVAGAIAGVAVRDLARRVAEAVPDRLAAPVELGRALDLVRRRGRTPREVARKAHPFTAPRMIPLMMCRPRNRKTASSGRIETNVPVRTSA